MSAPAELRDAAGLPLTAKELYARPLELSAKEAALVRAAARRDGRVLERDGLALYGLGLAASIELPGGLSDKAAAPRASELLGELAAEERATPVALAALPFDPTSPGRLVLPRLVLTERAGVVNAVEVGRAVEGGALASLLSEAAAKGELAPPPESFTLAALESHEAFRGRVREALQAIAEGRLEKVVLAREVTVTADRAFEAAHLLGRLRQLHPSCLSFSIEEILGASPELLCKREGGRVTSGPLAGTVARSGDPEQDRRLAQALLASEKERAEHAVVVEAIAAGLAPFVSALEVPAVPHLLELRNVVHLQSTIEGRLGRDQAGCLELVAALHPTPAVAGAPREAALEYLRRHERTERGGYAGPVGYLEASGDGEFWLAIRSAMLSGNRARLLAGVGIVEGSDPDAELAETQLKLQALLAAAVRP